jgi:hypothetical protein
MPDLESHTGLSLVLKIVQAYDEKSLMIFMAYKELFRNAIDMGPVRST